MRNRCLLQISNRACIHAENAEIYKTVAYYKYQIVLLALQDRRLLQISNRTGSRVGSALMCTGTRLITDLKPLVDVGNHKILLLQKYIAAGGENF